MIDLDELERLYQETTQGEWGCFDPVNNHVVTTDLVDGMYGYPSAEMVGTPDYDFTIAVKNAFPALLALARDGERYRERFSTSETGGLLVAENAAIDAARKGEHNGNS